MRQGISLCVDGVNATHTHSDRPRERLLAGGPDRLSDRDLVSVILGTGTRGRTAQRVAEDVVRVVDDRGALVTAPDFAAVLGLGPAKTATLMAAMELGRRVVAPAPEKIRSPADILPLVAHYSDRPQECFLVVCLNGAHEVQAVRVVTVGLLNRTVVHPREVFAPAVAERSAAIVAAHNHPSGNLDASPEDHEVTRRLASAGELLGIPLLDHIIFSRTGYFSFLENGEM